MTPPTLYQLSNGDTVCTWSDNCKRHHRSFRSAAEARAWQLLLLLDALAIPKDLLTGCLADEVVLDYAQERGLMSEAEREQLERLAG